LSHLTYDHTSIPATIEALFNLPALTQRDEHANNVLTLTSLATPRQDAPLTLPPTANPAAGERALRAGTVWTPEPAAVHPAEPIETQANLPGFLYVAMKSDLDISPPDQHGAIAARVSAIQTRQQARDYIEKVREKIRAARAGLKVTD
jgi:phospholipase C